MAVQTKTTQYEAKHIAYITSSEDPDGDACIVKEVIHHPDGSQERRIRVIRDFQRDWYRTREGHQKHTDKKGSEKLTRLQKFTTNDRCMPKKLVRILRKNPNNLNMRRLSRDKFLYGSDIKSPAILKKMYQDKFPDAISESTVAVLDIETDVRSAPLPENQEIIYIGLTMKDKAFLCYTDSYLKRFPNADTMLQEAFDTYLGEVKKARGITLETLRVADPGEAVYETFKRAHQWQPDFLAIFNIDFDMGVMQKMAKKYGYDAGTVFCDPSIPEDLRSVEYVQGPAKRITSSGKTMSFNPWERWHTMHAAASFYPICAMSTYAFIRKAAGNELSYKLDDILAKILGKRKLKFAFADHITDTGEWHFFMQKHYPIEYGIYCLFDCIGVEELDEETSDLSTTLPELTGFSAYSDFSSTPKQLADDMHFFHLSRGSVIGSTSDQMETELDKYVVSREGWIITLPTQLVEDNGLRVVEGMPDQPTLYRAHVADLDIRSAYPWAEICANISVETTVFEMARIEGVSIEDQKIIGLNIAGGITNSVEFCTTVYQLPTFKQVLEEYDKAA